MKVSPDEIFKTSFVGDSALKYKIYICIPQLDQGYDRIAERGLNEQPKPKNPSFKRKAFLKNLFHNGSSPRMLPP